MQRVSFKVWLSIATLLLIAVILYAARHELARAWQLLGSVNPWILLLLLPTQALSYYAAGAMVFSYLRDKFDVNINPIESAKLALELNFVNHILPSAGVSGASYMSWRLGKLGVSPGRAALAQVVRFVATFAAFLALLFVAILAITLDNGLERMPILVSSGLASAIIIGTMLTAYIIQSPIRLNRTAGTVTKAINKLWQNILRQPKPLIKREAINRFFTDLHEDYKELARDPSVLKKPLGWGVVFILTEVSLFWITFWALGTPINPAPLLIGYGLAGFAGSFFFTPGGVGGYEALMVGFLAGSGIDKGAAIAAILLSRAILVLLTIVSGYYFYQKAINSHGKPDSQRQ